MMTLLDQFLGAMYGVAIGDALGGTTEFMTTSQIKQTYGYLTEIIGGGVWDLEPGETTDDTAMTLCVAKGIIANPHDPIPLIGKEFLKWAETLPKDIGIATRAAFGLFQGNWEEAAKQAHFVRLDKKSAGNGTLMRCLPVALAYPDRERMETITRQQSKMTHYDHLADEACVIYNRIAHRLLAGEKMKEAICAETQGTEYEQVVLNEKPDCPPSGFVVDTLKWVLVILMQSESFAEVVQKAANAGGDTDTIGAIAGGLAGLYWGIDGIPNEYKSTILLKQELEEVARKLWSVAGGGSPRLDGEK